MRIHHHFAVFINNQSNKDFLINSILKGLLPEDMKILNGLQGVSFSIPTLNKFIDAEERHEKNTITKNYYSQSLKSMSSGEQKKALLKHLLSLNPDFIILDNSFDNLDITYQKELKTELKIISEKTILIQLVSRRNDLLPFIHHYASLDKKTLLFHEKNKSNFSNEFLNQDVKIPKSLHTSSNYEQEKLIEFKDVNVSFNKKPILNNLNWTIRSGEFWQLIGPNGSGKTTILSMLTGENSKGYGQELFIFGKRKGSGESIWDIKKKIGYFTPTMTEKFSGQHTVLNMVISGLFDSVGLYKKPTENQVLLGNKWLEVVGMQNVSNSYFNGLTIGQKRLIMTVRAMIKHPLLLILDEPTSGLDDSSSSLFVSLVNKIASETKTAIVFVSHREEKGLQPNLIYGLKKTPLGSIGSIKKTST